MLQYLIDALKSRSEFSAWQVTKASKRSHQLFLIREEVESVRQVDTVKYYVTVHQERQDGGGDGGETGGGKKVMGESSFVFLEGDDPAPMLELALEMASRVSNQPWTLPGPDQRYVGSEIKDESIVLNPDKIIRKVQEEILHAVGELEGVRLSSSELFANYTEYEMENSLGLKSASADTDMMFDFVLLTGEGHAEVESSGYKTRPVL